jgi:nucleoside-diphosphate-sugar epimerase
VTTVLVTGTTGHVGGVLAERVRAGGLNVRALVRTDEQVRATEQLGWQAVRGDLAQPKGLAHALSGVDLVLHCAAKGSRDSAQAQVVNVEGTRALAAEALAAGVDRFVHISTISVHGDPLPAGEVTEETPLAPDDPEPYCATKARGEQVLADARSQGLETVILRPGMICNVRRSQWGDEMVERMRTRGWPPDLHPGDVLPWLHTENLAEMSWLALTHPAAGNETFLAVDRNVSMNEFFVPIATVFGQRVVVPDRAPIVSVCRLGKLGTRLGYRAPRTFEATMEQLVALARAALPPGNASPAAGGR